MKLTLLSTAFVLALSSCSDPNALPGPLALSSNGVTLTSETNPDASLTASDSDSVPYQGDWILLAFLADGSTRYGLASLSVKASGRPGVVNAAGGIVGWSTSQTAAANDEQGSALVGTINVSGQARLFATMVPRDGSAARFYFEDYDGKVETIRGKATLGGQGRWTTPGTTITQNATFALVQISTVASVRAQALPLTREQGAEIARKVQTTLALAGPAALRDYRRGPAVQTPQ